MSTLYEFVAMSLTGAIVDDVTYRGYDCGHDASLLRLRKALKRAGFTTGTFGLIDCQTKIKDMGLSVKLEPLATMLNEWYIWDRLRKGEIRKWKTRSMENVE